MWVLALSAQAASPLTPLCEEVMVSIRDGGRKRDIVQLIQDSALSDEDVTCLQRDPLPAYVGRKAQAWLLKSGGLAALPTGPVDVWALVPDPCAIVGAQSPIVGLFGQVACNIDLTGFISERVTGYIEEQAMVALEEQGLQGEVRLVSLELPATTGISWEGGAERANPVSAGQHYVLHIHLPDAITAARTIKGDLLVGIGARRGMDIASEVRTAVRQEVWSQLAAHHVPSVLVEVP